MRWIVPRSRAIALFGWDEAASELVVRFRNGNFYVFRDIDPDDALEVMEAKAPGRTYNEVIRAGGYSERIIGHPDLAPALRESVEAGFPWLALSTRDPAPRPIRTLAPAEVKALESQTDTDGDCNGEHSWVISGRTLTDAPNLWLWHVNEESGLVVPPTPRVLWRRKPQPA